MLFLAKRVRRPGILMLVYLYSYAVTQFLIFFTRANDIVSFMGLNWGLKQAQWTSLVVLVALLPLTYWLIRYSKPVPDGATAATYGIVPRPTAVPAGTVTKIVEVTDQDKNKKNVPAIRDEKPIVIPKHEIEIVPEESAEQLPSKSEKDISDVPTSEIIPDEEKVETVRNVSDEPTSEILPDEEMVTTVQNGTGHISDEPTSEILPDEEMVTTVQNGSSDISDVPTSEIIPDEGDTIKATQDDVQQSKDEEPEVVMPEDGANKGDEEDVEDVERSEKDEEAIEGEVKEVPEEKKASGKKKK
jgi:hypothetical protein